MSVTNDALRDGVLGASSLQHKRSSCASGPSGHLELSVADDLSHFATATFACEQRHMVKEIAVTKFNWLNCFP